MATSKSSSLKEKGTSPSTPAPSTGRRSPRPSGSPDRRLSTRTTISDKPAHLKPKPSPSTSTTKFTNSSPSTATHSPPSPAGKCQPMARKPIEKPPSPSRKPIERTLSTPTTTRERSLKPASPSPVPRPYLSSRTSLLPLDKGAKSTAAIGAKTGSFTRSKSLDKRKAVAVSSAFVNTSSASDSEASVIKKAELESHVDESPKAEEEEIHKHEHEQIESPGVTSNIAQEEATNNADDIVPEQVEETQPQTLVTENEDEDEAVVAQEEEEPKPEEIKEGTMPVDESTKEAAAEPALQEAAAAKPAGPRVAAVDGAKEAQRNNDVIEEAKSKFFEKRKNKVLALVGAFETVMALQEPEAGQQSQQTK